MSAESTMLENKGTKDVEDQNNNKDSDLFIPNEEEKMSERKNSISSDGDTITSNESTLSFSFASFLLIIIINAANFVNGLYMAVPGPTLLFLAESVSSDVGQVSTILAGRSAGNLLGAFAASLISKNSGRYFNATMKLGLSFIVAGALTLSIPFVSELWILIAVLSIGGFLFGFSNTGFLAIQLDIWGEKKSRPLMQLYQGIFSMGAMMAPLIASPFLGMAAEGSYKKPNTPSCSKDNVTDALSNLTINGKNGTVYESQTVIDINPVTWIYIIIGALSLLIAIIMIILSLGGIEDGARVGEKVSSESRPEEPLSRVAVVLLCVICFYAFQVGSVNVFASYIYSVSYCSKLQFSVSTASSLNSLYWGLFIVGRLIAFVAASKLRPSTLITGCIFTLLTSTAIMSALGEEHEFVAWATTGMWALAISPLFGSGVSWVSQITNVSGRYAVIFEIGAAIGAVGAFPIAGILFDINPYSVIYFVSGLIGLLGISYIGMLITGRQHLQRRSAREAAYSEAMLEKHE
ncbi:sodium-dependent glucose transporter 1A-like [Styela clava]